MHHIDPFPPFFPLSFLPTPFSFLPTVLPHPLGVSSEGLFNGGSTEGQRPCSEDLCSLTKDVGTTERRGGCNEEVPSTLMGWCDSAAQTTGGGVGGVSQAGKLKGHAVIIIFSHVLHTCRTVQKWG